MTESQALSRDIAASSGYFLLYEQLMALLLVCGLAVIKFSSSNTDIPSSLRELRPNAQLDSPEQGVCVVWRRLTEALVCARVCV